MESARRRFMTPILYLAGIQALTCCGLGICFLRAGNWRLGVTQMLYGIATILIFGRRP